MSHFLIVGSVNADMVFFVDSWPAEHSKVRANQMILRQGGAAGNVACVLARLGHSVSIAAAVGMDKFGDFCVSELERCGVDTSLIQRVNGEAGVAAAVQYAETKRIITSGSVNQNLDTDLIARSARLRGAHLHWVASKTRNLKALIDVALSEGSTISCECNGQEPPDMVGKNKILFMNRDEAQRLCKEGRDMDSLCSEMSSNQLAKVVITEGPIGATAFSWKAGPTRVRLSSGNVVQDRTGGGDAFVAGYLSAWIKGRDEESCLKYALDIALITIGTCRRTSWKDLSFGEV